MTKNNICALVLAGGRGNRMNSIKAKPLQELLSVPAIAYIIEELKKAKLKIFVIANEEVEVYLNNEYKDVTTIRQNSSGYGTAFAVKNGLEYIKSFERVLILQGDDPLISENDINRLIKSKDNALICAKYKDTFRNCGGVIIKKDAIKEMIDVVDSRCDYINLGRYIFNIDELSRYIKIYQTTSKEEYKLPDVINLMIKNKYSFECIVVEEEFSNMNTKKELYEVTKILQKRINTILMDKGVIFDSLETSFIGPFVEIGNDTRISGYTQIFGKTTIGEGCLINNSYIINSLIENETNILFSYIEDAIISNRVIVGPFAHLRYKSYIESNAVIGNFVEIKNSTIGEGTKACHLSYIGDTRTGKKCNIGCGSITANYDGKKKYRTDIGSHCFIGCNSTLIAPVTIGNNSFIAAGSTITEDVKEDSLAIGRSKQVIKDGWAKDYLNKE